MKILQELNSECRIQGLSYVLIGGHAIVARGYGRTTRDLDLAVPESLRQRWKDFFLRMGYTVYHEQSGFIQFTAPDLGEWPVDLMIVDGATFSRLEAEATPIRLGDGTAPVASVTHLILMKLHSLKTGHPDRFAKDLADLLELLRLRGLEVGSAEFLGMCEKYADGEIHERIIGFLKKR